MLWLFSPDGFEICDCLAALYVRQWVELKILYQYSVVYRLKLIFYRFVVGPYEESICLENYEDTSHASNAPVGKRSKGIAYKLVSTLCSIYARLTKTVQEFSKHPTCPHPFSCTYYTLQVSLKLFSTEHYKT